VVTVGHIRPGVCCGGRDLAKHPSTVPHLVLWVALAAVSSWSACRAGGSTAGAASVRISSTPSCPPVGGLTSCTSGRDRSARALVLGTIRLRHRRGLMAR